MEFGLSDDQRMFQDSIKGYLDSAAALDTVRQVVDGDAEAGRAITSGMNELGVGQVLIPESHDGLGLGLLDAALIQEALGAAVAPVGHMATAMATIGICAAGTEAEKADWLPKIASGEARFGIAVTEHIGAREGAGVTAQNGQLSGKTLFAMETADATHILVSSPSLTAFPAHPTSPSIARAIWLNWSFRMPQPRR